MRTIDNFLRPGFLTVLTLLVLVSGHSDASARQADEIIGRLNQKYETLDAFRATFLQHISTAQGDGVSTTSGTLLLSGEMYRIETEYQTIVTDGTTTWVHNKPENQVLVADHEENDDFISPSTFFTGYADQYDASYGGREQLAGVAHHVVRLLPRDRNSFIQDVTLWVRDSDTMITQMKVQDINQTIMDFRLRDIELNPPVAADAFRFTAPAGADVVDLRN